MASPTSQSHVDFDIEARRSPGSNLDLSSSTRSEFNKDAVYPLPDLTRRQSRRNTSKTNRTIDHSEARPNWHPGQEPGLDTKKANGGRATTPTFHEQCQITVVDFCKKQMRLNELNNKELIDFVKKPLEDWVSCRWISVNGLDWDVIQALGQYKNLHQLAIEDMLNTNNRTKVDWYEDHTYMVFTLQKLIHMHRDQESDSESESDSDAGNLDKPKRNKKPNIFRRMFADSEAKQRAANLVHDPANDSVTGHTEGTNMPVQKFRTLQRYHGGPNEARMEYMEKHSPLTRKQLAVSAEQVSIFLTSDNTVISFFESSADDIEGPIVHRLNTPETVLRRSCDASMLVQAIIDATIDLAIPVAAAYQDVIGDLELDVLTNPSIKQCTSLYIMTSEVTSMRNFVSPIQSLINALQDHKSDSAKEGGRNTIEKDTATSVRISRMSQTYLGDVEDHIVLITDSLDQLRRTCDNMIDFIFNTISAFQNESMKQLTIVTIIFLPLTFLVGYFGMNLTHFASLDHNEAWFWSIATPVFAVTGLFLMRDRIWWWVARMWRQRWIRKSRSKRARKVKTRETEGFGNGRKHI